MRDTPRGGEKAGEGRQAERARDMVQHAREPGRREYAVDMALPVHIQEFLIERKRGEGGEGGLAEA